MPPLRDGKRRRPSGRNDKFWEVDRAREEKSVPLGAAEGDVDDGLEVDGLAILGSRLEFPLLEGLDGVGVELLVESAHQLNAVNGAVMADHAVEDHFPLHML